MGHSTIKMTERYAKLVDTNLEDAIKVLNSPSDKPNLVPPSPTFDAKDSGKVIPFRRPA